MTARIYSIAFVLASGFLGLPYDLPFTIAQTTTPQTQTSESKPIALSLQQPIARELKGGETHSYVVSLKAGQFFQAIAEQKGIDLVILLYSPSGKSIARSDSPNDRLGLEVMSVIADRDGIYRLEINAPDGKAATGKYVLKVKELRVASDRDRKYVAAERAFMEAVVLNGANTQQTEDRKRQALAKYLEAIPVFREQEKFYLEMWSNISAGRIYSDFGEITKSIDFYQQSIIIARKISDRNDEATSLNNLGLAYDNLGQYQNAIDFYQQSLAIFKQIGDRNGEARSQNNLGGAYNNLGQYQKAIDFFQQSLAIKKQIGDHQGEAAPLNNLGLAYNNLGQYQKAIDFYQQSLVISKQIGDHYGEATSINNLAAAYNNFGQYRKAIDSFQQSLAIFKQIGDRQGEARSINNLGDVYNHLGQYQKAINFFQQSLVISKQIGDRNIQGLNLNNLGVAYNNLGQYQKAIDFFQQSLAIQKQIEDRQGEARSINNLGDVYIHLGQYQKAIDFFQQSLAIFKQIGDRNGEAGSINNLGGAYNNLGQYQKAIDFFQQSLAIFKQIGDRNGEARSINNVGGAYNNLGQYQKVIDSYQQSLAIKKQIGDRQGEGTTLSNLGFLFAQQKQPELAILFYKQSINIRESIRKDIRRLSKEEQNSYLSTAEDTYRELINLLLKQGRVTEALQIIDLLKVQELEDYLKNVKGNDRTAQGIRLLEPEKAISGQLSAISFEKISELNRDLVSKIQQLPKSEINKVPDYLQKLPQGTVLIYPLILEDRLELIVFSANTLPINRTILIKKVELEKLVAAFRADLQDRSSLDVKDSSKKVYEVLIKPIEADLKQANATTILYAPDGTLRYIPLAALYDGKQWLVEKYRVNNLIAYSLFDPDSKPQPNIRIFTGAFGNSDKGIPFNLSRLPATIPEVDRIQSLFPNATKLVEQDFTAQASKEKVSGNAIVHFATHAKFISGSPLESYVLFGDGSKVTLAEINEWQLKDADLVVLSACETGVGSLGNGSEILGFGYQVQRAGAKASIASLWRVSDGGTQLLMEAFYGNLQKGNASMSTSLREAQLSMIRRPIKDGGVNYNHPYYWSAFVLIGNGL